MANKVTFGNLNESALTQKVILSAKETYNAYPIKGGNGILLIQNDYANVEVYINGTNDFNSATKLSLTLRGKKWTFENIDGNLRLYDNFYIWTIGTSEIDIILEVTQDAPNIDYYLGNSTISESLITSVSQSAQNNITAAVEQVREDFQIEGLLNIENLNVFISGHNTALQTYLKELKALEDELEQAYTNLENYYKAIGSPTAYQWWSRRDGVETTKPKVNFDKYIFSTTDYANYQCPLPLIGFTSQYYQYWSHGWTERGNITFSYDSTTNKYVYRIRGEINTNGAGGCVIWKPGLATPFTITFLHDDTPPEDMPVYRVQHQEFLDNFLPIINDTLEPTHANYARAIPVLLQLINEKQTQINSIKINNGAFTLKKRVYSNAVYIDLNLDIINSTPVKVDFNKDLQYNCMYALAKIRNISKYDLLIEGKTILNGNLQNIKPENGKIGFSKIAIELLDEENYKVASQMIDTLNTLEFPWIKNIRKNSIEYTEPASAPAPAGQTVVKNILDGIDITGDLININNLHDRPLSENTLTRVIKSGNEIGVLFSFEAFGDKLSTNLQELRTINVNGGLSIKNKGVYIKRNTLDEQEAEKNNNANN